VPQPFSFHRLRARCRLVLLWGLFLVFPRLGHAGGTATEYSVKAAFIYNFARFIQWPPGTFSSKDGAIVLGVLGEGDFPADLQAINGRSVPGHGQNRVISLKRLAGPQDIDHCQILFILHSGEGLTPAVMREAGARNMLTVVEDCGDLAQTGAVINLFKTEGNRIRFEINVDAAKRADLSIDSPLLNLAKMVREHRTGPGN